MTLQSFSSTIYEKEIPAFAGPELERLYSSVYSSLPQLMMNISSKINTYVSRINDETRSLFLFELKGPLIRVLNEGIRIDEEEIRRFSECLFSKYPSAKLISLHAVDGTLCSRSIPCQQYNVLEDIVLTMPDTAEEYLAALGKSTRSYINRYMNKIRRELPSFTWDVYIGAEFDKQEVIELIEMHKARMSSKEKESIIDDKRMQEIFQLLKEYGFVVIARVDGKICGGTINYRVGSDYFLETVAHDSQFNDYRIGTICSYLTICECIARSGREYHFLWGEYDYKFRLGGVRRELNDLFIYRSRAQFFLSSDFFLTTASKNRIHQLRKRLRQKAGEQDTLISRMAANALAMLQRGKKILPFSS